jgi:hypothetical protein
VRTLEVTRAGDCPPGLGATPAIEAKSPVYESRRGFGVRWIVFVEITGAAASRTATMSARRRIWSGAVEILA